MERWVWYPRRQEKKVVALRSFTPLTLPINFVLTIRHSELHYGRYPLFFWLLDIAILNAYLIGRQLHKDKDSYIEHKEFRVQLWSSLFSYSACVSSERKLAKFYTPTTMLTPYTFRAESSISVESSHRMEEQQVEHKWKMLGKRVYCYNCRAIYSATRKRNLGDEICINGVQRKRAGQTLWACNICDSVQVAIVGPIITRRKYSN
jgi:hypothetical protein